LRPINLGTDLGQLADLMEACFNMDETGRAVIRELRMISTGGRLAGFLLGMERLLGNLQQGYVWVEDGRVIGNTSLSPANYPREFGKGSIISNVAVYPEFRRRGIAATLVEKSLERSREQGNRFAVLQVDAVNEGAQRLYERLGFRVERSFTRWQRHSRFATPSPLLQMPRLWLRPPEAWKAELELAELVRPNRLGGMGWLRPTNPRLFRPGWLWTLLNSFVGSSTESYVVYRDESQRSGIIGAVRLMSSFGSADRLDLLVHPFHAGKLEEPLLNYILRRLDGRRQHTVIEHPADDQATAVILANYAFEARQTLVNMRLDF
jgi:ribosomal protein S18 acetylase RimI-like enzyme